MKYMIAVLLAAMSLTALAQPPGAKKEKIDAMRVAFITQELDLTPQEAQSFWPVYNQFDNELDALRKARKNALMDARDNFDNMSDADMAKAIDAELNFQQQELDLRKRYVAEFKKVLPVKKVALLMRAEQRFKMKLLQEYQRRDGDGPPPPPGGGRQPRN
jgi:hypothetical protein